MFTKGNISVNKLEFTGDLKLEKALSTEMFSPEMFWVFFFAKLFLFET